MVVVGVFVLGVTAGGLGSWSCGGDTETGAGGSSGGGGVAGHSTGGGGSSTGGGTAGTAGTGGAGGAGGHAGGASMCGDPTVMAQYPTCRAAQDQTTCEDAGGSWTAIGLSPDPLCVCPTGQAGCTCTRSTECLAPCRAPTSGGVMECEGVTEGECAAHAPFAGCWCFFDENGTPSGICID